MTTTATTTQVRPLYVIARDIDRNWKNVYFGAVPYLDALRSLDQITDSYGFDSADSVVRYLLSNSTTWRGSDARRVKSELRAMLEGR